MRQWAWSLCQIVVGLVLLAIGTPLWDGLSTKGTISEKIYASFPCLVIAAVALAIPVVGSGYQKRMFAKRECSTVIKRVLKGLSDCFPSPNRTNIMLVRSAPDGPRRKVESATAHNMDDDPDNDLEIDATAGVSGRAWVERAFTWGDLTKAPPPGAPTWGLRRTEQGRVRQTLKTIASAPIIDTDGKPYGTLQVDSDLHVDEFLPNPKSGGNILARFADVIALFLRERG